VQARGVVHHRRLKLTVVVELCCTHESGRGRFDNRALESLPIDSALRQGVSCEPITRDETKEALLCTHARHHIPKACYSLARTSPVAHPRLVAASQYALNLLKLAPTEAGREDFVDFFSGNTAIPGARPAAHNYGGHQFGSFAGQLGDGACVYLGEIEVGEGHGTTAAPRWELQLKGSGKTPYSRQVG